MARQQTMLAPLLYILCTKIKQSANQYSLNSRRLQLSQPQLK